MLTSVLRDLGHFRGYSVLTIRATTHHPRSQRLPAQQQRLLAPRARARPPTYQEVEDGHVDDVEEAAAAVVRVDLFHGVAVQRVDLPPEGEKKSWGWKSQDGKVLGGPSFTAPAPSTPCLPDPTPGCRRLLGMPVAAGDPGGPWEKVVLGPEHPFCWALQSRLGYHVPVCSSRHSEPPGKPPSSLCSPARLPLVPFRLLCTIPKDPPETLLCSLLLPPGPEWLDG